MRMSKVTMQQIADTMGVSRVTVWKALSNRPGVSEELRQRIMREAAAQGYSSAATVTAKNAQKRTVSVVVSRPESSTFWMEIIHHLAKELAKQDINLMYTYMPTTYRSGFSLPASLSSDAIMGFIVLNIYNERLLRRLAAHPLPKVFLDTVPALQPDDLCGDLVLLEGRSRTREITGRLLDSGRRRLGFIGDIAYAQTNTDRYLGFLDAHEARGIEPDARLSMTDPIHLHTHYEDISRFLDGLEALPGAFVCASDFIAHYVQRYLQERKRAAPDSFVLTGFDNNGEYQNVAKQITTVDVQTAALGKRLAQKLLFRAANATASYEVAYVISNILYRGALA